MAEILTPEEIDDLPIGAIIMSTVEKAYPIVFIRRSKSYWHRLTPTLLDESHPTVRGQASLAQLYPSRDLSIEDRLSALESKILELQHTLDGLP